MNEALKIVVLAKQVPDTRNVGKDAMKADGTVNRAALAAIFNPEDLNALEQALRIKDRYPKSTITILTMGPFRAAEVIREAMFRGADGGILLTDRKFAGADTLATSYTLACAIKKMNPDLIVAGRQAIDGDTAQVGPQVAEKLGLPQVTYAEQIDGIDVQSGEITIRRRLEHGVETVTMRLPGVITVNASAPECRPRNAKMVMKYKHARTVSEVQEQQEDYYLALHKERCYLCIPEWGAADVNADPESLGLSGSPTKVKKIENIVFQAKEAKHLTGEDAEIEGLMKELIASHTIG
ncbi:MAG: electron transfer flavoprotein subunit beta/FixA family protein [Rikenellaceae bacterium]|nr:electron transfer flavoprotein subunit beta/FixA family protein [Rikenellaceae bacterium]